MTLRNYDSYSKLLELNFGRLFFHMLKILNEFVCFLSRHLKIFILELQLLTSKKTYSGTIYHTKLEVF